MKKKRLTPGRINRLFGLYMAIFLVIVAVFYWCEQISQTGLILIAIMTITAGVLFVFGVRRAQADGFLDGYVRAKNHFDGKKK